MSSFDELMAWLREPLQELRSAYDADPAAPWDERRAWLLDRLGIYDPGQHPLVEQLLRWLDELSDTDRADVLRGDQLEARAQELARELAPATEEQDDGASAYDENAWAEYLAAHGTAWDGTDESWGQFRDWFLYYAEERGVADPATALLDYLGELPVDDRIAAFARYDVVIEQEETEEPATDEEEVAVDEEVADAAMAELLQERPEFAQIPEERRRELMAQVLREHQEETV